MDDGFAADEIAPLAPMAVARALGGFWLVFVGLNTLRAAVLAFANPLGAFERRLVVAMVGVALSWAMYRMLVRFRRSSLRTGILLTFAMSLPAALVFSTVNFLFFDLLTPMPGESCHPGLPCTIHDLVVEVSDMLINWAFVFGAWGLLYLSLASAAQTRAADLRSSAHREAARLAQISALRYQVNPHFLFNTLNSLSSLVMTGKAETAERMILNLSTFFRTSLTGDPTEDMTLDDEIRLQRLYLDIEAVRFPERLVVSIDVPAALGDACVPGLILQPLVENAVKYGVSRARRPVTIRIAAREDNGAMRLTVEDDGAPLPDDEAGRGTGVGLRNVADRIAARFGDAGTCVWGSRPAGGFVVTLTLPIVRRGC